MRCAHWKAMYVGSVQTLPKYFETSAFSVKLGLLQTLILIQIVRPTWRFTKKLLKWLISKWLSVVVKRSSFHLLAAFIWKTKLKAKLHINQAFSCNGEVGKFKLQLLSGEKKMSASKRNNTQLLSKQRPWDDHRDSLPDWCFESELIEK